MDWALLPALLGASLTAAIGIAAAVRPSALGVVGVTSGSPLGTSEIRAVFGGMFLALGLACLLLRVPIVFAVVGTAWLADFAVRLVAVFVDGVPAKDAAWVLGVALVIGLALLSGYWLA